MENPAPRPQLVLIGTGHVFQISEAIRGAVEAVRPDVVFVELDRGRLRALLDRRAGKAAPVAGNWFHRRLQSFQERVAESYGAEAGEEMLAAVDGAHNVAARIGLVDRPVDITLKRAMKELTWRERLRGLRMLVGGALRSILPSTKSGKEQIDEEMAAYKADPEGALDEMAKSFPTVRRVVIDERDDWMAARIRRGMELHASGIAVVGDGHIPGLLHRLGDFEPTVYRLSDVQAGKLPKPTPGDTNSASFSFDVAPT